jgi:MYXO-CTERM domain-containing protein
MIIRLLLLAALALLAQQCHAPASPPAPLGFAAIAQPASTLDSPAFSAPPDTAVPDPVAPEPPPVTPEPPPTASTPLPAVPGPLPLLGLGAALAWARRLRRRIRAAQPTARQQ